MKSQRLGADQGGSAIKKPRYLATSTPTATDARTRLRTECALQIERAHEPGDIQRVMEDLTPSVLRDWPDLLPLLARRVVAVCRNDLVVLQQALEFCLPADLWKVVDLDAVEPHPWGDQAEEVLLLWIAQADAIALPSAQAVLGRVALHLQRARQQAGRDFTEANPACAEALRTLKQREASLEGLPGDALRHVVRYLDPDLGRPQLNRSKKFNQRFVNEAKQWALACKRAYLSVAQVNHAAYQELLPLLQQAWGLRAAAQLEGIALDSFPEPFGAQPPLQTAAHMRLHLQKLAVSRQMIVGGPSAWTRMWAFMHSAFYDTRVGDSLLIALFAQDDRERVVQALGALLEEAMGLLDDKSLSDAQLKDLKEWPFRALALAYQKWLAPEEEAFKRLVDATRAQAHRLPPAERIYLLLELAAVTLTDAPRFQAVMGLVDALRQEAQDEINWVLIGDCLNLLRGTPGALTDQRIDDVLHYLTVGHCFYPPGAALAMVVSAIVRCFHRLNNAIHVAILLLMRDATDRQQDEPLPRLYHVVFSLFEGSDILMMLLRSCSNEEILSRYLHPPTKENLPLWRRIVTRTSIAPDIARRELSAAMSETGDADLRSELQALLNGLAWSVLIP